MNCSLCWYSYFSKSLLMTSFINVFFIEIVRYSYLVILFNHSLSFVLSFSVLSTLVYIYLIASNLRCSYLAFLFNHSLFTLISLGPNHPSAHGVTIVLCLLGS